MSAPLVRDKAVRGRGGGTKPGTAESIVVAHMKVGLVGSIDGRRCCEGEGGGGVHEGWEE